MIPTRQARSHSLMASGFHAGAGLCCGAGWAAAIFASRIAMANSRTVPISIPIGHNFSFIVDPPLPVALVPILRPNGTHDSALWGGRQCRLRVLSLAHDVSGLISTRYVRFLRSGQGARCMSGDRHELLPDGRPGAYDKDPRSDLASFGEEDYVVASSRDHRDHRPTDAAVALALQGVWL